MTKDQTNVTPTSCVRYTQVNKIDTIPGPKTDRTIYKTPQKIFIVNIRIPTTTTSQEDVITTKRRIKVIKDSPTTSEVDVNN